MKNASPPNTIIFLRRTRRVWDRWEMPTNLSRKREGKKSGGTPKRRREASIKMKVKETICMFTRFIWFRTEFSDGHFDDGGEISGPMKGKEFLD
jgi:hypothetical protein